VNEPTAYEFEDIRVDLARLEVTRAGQPVTLEPKAFDVLRLLIHGRDRLVSKEELLDAVWRDTHDRGAASYPAWSPDGRWLAIELKREDTTQLAVVPAAGGAIEQLTAEHGQTWPHSWSPDGDRIAFAGQRGGVWNIWTVSRRTRQTRPLTRFTSATGFVRYPSWSPRGDRIAFERARITASVWAGVAPLTQ